METRLTGKSKEIVISYERPTVLIGERINPAGKKKLAESLKQRNFEIACKEAVDQLKAGADILDVNVTVFGIDETPILPEAIKAIQNIVDVPLCIDSANPVAI
jgi:5-methyltetrahydrofolate--homocysteine methyltransferase